MTASVVWSFDFCGQGAMELQFSSRGDAFASGGGFDHWLTGGAALVIRIIFLWWGLNE
jgi:hypothetical protein